MDTTPATPTTRTPVDHPDLVDGNPYDLLVARGFVHDTTDASRLRELLGGAPISYYVGFDPTASSLHIGNLVGMMAMAWLQKAGHRPIALAGGATGRIGDPSGRDAERSLLDEDVLATNLAGIRRDLGLVLDLSTPDRGILVDNFTWTEPLSFLDFLRDVGKHFSVNQMIARESVKRRLENREQGISFTEFSYQLLQAHDFAHLYTAEGCVLQGGGSDQWGNIVAGVELTRRMHGGDVEGICWPLVEDSGGRKFGKSAGNAVWLDAAMLSPWAFHQWWLNVHDDDVVRNLKLFTFLPVAEIEELAREHAEAPFRRVAHRRLADEVTRIIHGDEAVDRVTRAAAVLFGKGAFRDLDDAVLAEAFTDVPSHDYAVARLDADLTVAQLLVDLPDAAASLSEARRLVAQGGVRLSNVVVDDPERLVTADDLATPTTIVVRLGKKRQFLARFA